MDQLPGTAVQTCLLEGRQDGSRSQRSPVRSCRNSSLGERVIERPGPEVGEAAKDRSSILLTLRLESNLSSPPHLLSIQSSVVQAGHAALEAEFRHPIVDQKEVPQLRGRGTRNSAKRGHILIQGRAARAFPGPRPTARLSQPSDAWLFGVPDMQTRC